MGRPKKKPKSDFVATKQHINAMAFCLNNGIKIYPVPVGNKEFKLIVEIDSEGNLKKTESPRNYLNHELKRPTYEIYLTYFKRMADEDIVKKSEKKYITFNKM